MKLFIYILSICPAGFLLLLFSCSSFSAETEEKFRLPQSESWTVKTSRNSSSEEFSVDGNSFYFSVNKNEATAILAYSGGHARPCGAIYPYSTSLSFQDGFAAEVLFTLCAASASSAAGTHEYLSKFNWQRFMEECAAFGEQSWKLDKERIMQKISSGTFKKTDFKLLE